MPYVCKLSDTLNIHDPCIPVSWSLQNNVSFDYSNGVAGKVAEVDILAVELKSRLIAIAYLLISVSDDL